MSIKKNLGNRIREIRVSRSLTQEALAEKINLSAKSLSQIELGNNFVSAETLEELCTALEINPNVLFDFKYSDVPEDVSLDEVIKRLKNNPNLLKTVYRIIKMFFGNSLYPASANLFIIRQRMLSSEFIKAGFFKPRKISEWENLFLRPRKLTTQREGLYGINNY